MADNWKRNLTVLSLAQLLTMIGFGSYRPFMAYYLQDIGAATFEQAIAWLAAFESGNAFAMMLASPFWGTLADRHGRKLMLMRATGAGAVTALLMTFARTPGQLVALRITQGLLCGTVSASLAMVATQTPERHLGYALGVMQTVQYVGHAVGPFFGGLTADSLGYRAVFLASAATIALALVLVVGFVKERFVAPIAEPTTAGRPRSRLRGMLTGTTVVLLLTLGALRFGMAVLTPVLSLFVKSLSPDTTRVATLAGAAVSVTALTSSIAALVAGRLGDRFGLKRVLLVCSLGVAAAYAAQATARTTTQLLLLRAIQGVFVGGTMPMATALLARSTPTSRRGVVFGISNSVTSGARALGPIVGAAVANLLGMRSVFLTAAAIVLGVSAGIGIAVRPEVGGTSEERRGRVAEEQASVGPS